MAAFFVTSAIGQIKIDPKVFNSAKPDLSVAKITDTGYPEFNKKFNIYSAQPTLEKTKGLSAGTFMVETTAFNGSGAIVKSCKQSFTWDDAPAQYIDHPKLRCDITDQAQAKSVTRWQTRVDTGKALAESDENNNQLEKVWLPDLKIEFVNISPDNNNMEVRVSNQCRGRSAGIPVQVKFYANLTGTGAAAFVDSKTTQGLDGGFSTSALFDISKFSKGKDVKSGKFLLFTVDPVNSIVEGNENNNKLTITNGTTSSPFPPSSDPCAPKYTKSVATNTYVEIK